MGRDLWKEVICSSPPVLSLSASWRGWKGLQGVRRTCWFSEALRKNYYLGPTSVSKVRSPLLQRWGVSPHSPHSTFLPFFLCTCTLHHLPPTKKSCLPISCITQNTCSSQVFGLWRFWEPPAAAQAPCPATVKRGTT